ncbi:MAG TPA: aminopeptidase [Candidatus Lachnoclostridium pullistercoris]|uniref:M18 family aminopeptidase n=1 Tax=Candidatus Lachnoclostridium pullistercoris TaxID=2838632 RepID=A0A9D2PCN8_9FIRM|nr:aminopeptidase [Candidatus Lachnoclostridium pullistercoris]
MTGKELQEKLAWKFPDIAERYPEQIETAGRFCEEYKQFLDRGKTERECVARAAEMLEAAGYRPFDRKASYRPGDKVYAVNRGKALIATTFGTEPAAAGLRLNGAHIDSPRLDLKPNPLYEKDGLALLKTHYYGGIRKYQWSTVPLSMHGVVYLEDGTKAEITLGEKDGEPRFCVTDLLPHLASEQNGRKLSEGIKGEELNVVIGSLPYEDTKDVKEAVKLKVLALLHEYYGMTEKDFIRAEIEMVPAYRAMDIGLDRGMVGAYGQDDRVCAYTALRAEIETKHPVHTTVTILTDKEEIGSVGNTGLNSDYVLHYIQKLAEREGADYKEVLEHSLCLSSDVNAAYDPTFSSVYETRNSCYVGKGCVLTKYTGARGKSSSNDASAEVMAKVVRIMDEAGVCWQTGELGAVDAGGGGTIAQFVAGLNVDVVDLGVPILSMHSPFELASKLDVYHTFLAFQAFYNAD